MADIVLTAGVRANLLQLQKTTDLITTTQSRLATGKRVNTALDNPVNFFTAQGLSNRASDLSNLLDSMSTAINTIQAANNGITSIRHHGACQPVVAVRRHYDPDRPARR
jgi:flagellin